MTDLDLTNPADRERLVELCRNAPSGPWTADHDRGYIGGGVGEYIAEYMGKNVGEFIIASRTAVPQLLQLVEGLVADLRTINNKKDWCKLAMERARKDGA